MSVEGREVDRRTYSIPLPPINDATAFPTDQCSLRKRCFQGGSLPLWLIFVYRLISSYLPNN